jgi:hypothetical protein
LLSPDDRKAIVDGIADHTIAYDSFDHARRSLGTALMLSISARLADRHERFLLMDAWRKREAIPAKPTPPEPLANGSLD